ncbi:hypothetical protein K488DRAFT_49187 [Vararia minispora EC-137]|uniref:Uncharacterized protein n=1 Tax=Vararia minispora EC-137 TaxID=1314806 RepID=A0ACB8QLM5_9AGAM|nr:hypothetical protein K488DRAFT_49187 [Vararia minispora EC-137]
MSWVAWLSLRLFHLVYAIYLALWSIYTRWFVSEPSSLTSVRDKLPAHLAVNLACSEDMTGDETVKEAFLACAERAVLYCRQAGIRRLTMYDRHGILLSASGLLKHRLSTADCAVQPERLKPSIVYPPTPPSSDDSDSQFSGDEALGDSVGLVTVCPELAKNEPIKKAGRTKGSLRRRSRACRISFTATPNVVVQVASQTAGKAVLASVANRLLHAAQQSSESMPGRDAKSISTTATELQYILEGANSPTFSAPDLMIVHNVSCPSRQCSPMELHAFPPWQIRLTEFFYDGAWSLRTRVLRHLADTLAPFSLLTEVEFRKALDEYASAQFRVGR